MRQRLFLLLLGAALLAALVSYILTVPHGADIPLVGVVDGNQVIISPQLSGRLVRLLVDEGSEVHAGQLLAELDPAELQAELRASQAGVDALRSRLAELDRQYRLTDRQTAAALQQAQATLTATQAQLREAQADLWRDEQDFARSQALFRSGIISAQDRDHLEAAVRADRARVASLEEQVRAQQAAVQAARAARDQLGVLDRQRATTRAQIRQARAQQQQAATRLGYMRLYAPLSGVVSVRVAREGEVVAAGAPVLVLVDVDHLWVRAEVEETYIDAIRLGQPLRVRLPSGRELTGVVFFKGVEGDFATQRDVSRSKRDVKTFAIKVAVRDPSRRLFTGMTATVLLPPLSAPHWWQRWWKPKAGTGSRQP
jgi:HlyD family secretion protein